MLYSHNQGRTHLWINRRVQMQVQNTKKKKLFPNKINYYCTLELKTKTEICNLKP